MKTLLRSAGRGLAGALLFVTVVWVVADASSGPLLAEDPDGVLAEVPLAGALIATVIGGVIGALLAYVLRSRPGAPRRFINICATLLVLYGVFAFVQAEDLVTGIWLNVMHLAAAAPIIDQMTRWLRAR